MIHVPHARTSARTFWRLVWVALLQRCTPYPYQANPSARLIARWNVIRSIASVTAESAMTDLTVKP
jgi:hypothetical protein